MWPRAMETDAVRGRCWAGDAAARADDADVRRPRVGNRQEPAGDRGRRRGRRRGGRGHHLPAPRRDRDRRALARGDRGGGDGGPRRAGSGATRGKPSASTARRSTNRWRSCCERAPAGAGRVLQRRPAGGADHRRARGLGLHGGGVVAYSYEAKEELLGVTEACSRPRGGLARGGRGDGEGGAGALRRRRRGLDHRDRRARAEGPRRSRSAYVCFNARARRRDRRSPAIRSIPGDRHDIRERSALVGDAPAAQPARRRRRPRVEREPSPDRCTRALSRAHRALAWPLWRWASKSPREQAVRGAGPARGGAGGLRHGARPSWSIRRCGRCRPKSLHVTLVFLGHRAAEEVEAIAGVVEARRGAGAVDAARRSRCRPGRGRAAALRPSGRSAGAASRPPRGLVADWSRRACTRPEERDFWPHVTVARVRPEGRGSRRPRRVARRPGDLPTGSLSPPLASG